MSEPEAPGIGEDDQPRLREGVEPPPRLGTVARGGEAGKPAGDVYDWYVRGVRLLSAGDAAAAVALLSHAHAAEPGSRQLREALGRAQYDAGDYVAAQQNFHILVEADPADDYARFGLGLSALRTGDSSGAVASLALAVAMRPDNQAYHRALSRARATVARH